MRSRAEAAGVSPGEWDEFYHRAAQIMRLFRAMSNTVRRADDHAAAAAAAPVPVLTGAGAGTMSCKCTCNDHDAESKCPAC